jgi:cytochrome c peroxidase
MDVARRSLIFSRVLPLVSAVALAAAAASCSSAAGPIGQLSGSDERVATTAAASTVDDLADQFAFFQDVFVGLGGHDQNFQVGAGFSPLCTEKLVANGLTASARLGMTMNPASGLVTRIQATLDGFPLNQAFDLWFVKNVPSSSILPEAGDTRVKVGSFTTVNTSLNELSLDVSPNGGFGGAVYDFDMVVVTRGGKDPTVSRLVTGERTFFEKRLFRQLAGIPMDPVTLPLASDVESLDPVVRAGSQIFFNETFGGNGRTCGTCHRRETNFTITPQFIATLPESDPLFVFETNPNLGQLENGALLRGTGLIRENVDGFDKPGVQRFTPHLFALGTSLNMTAQADRGYPASPPMHFLGRGSDGAPGRASLHEFGMGAIMQHFPKTLNRVPGVDFRLPTQAEADVLEAFQLFIGRSHEVDTTQLGFADATAQRGSALANFGAGKCSICHASIGGLKDFFENFDQGANARVTGLPFDDGFRSPLTNSIPQSIPQFEIPGAQLFNVTPLVEVASLGCFFHNCAVQTIEDAVAHYTTAAFANSSGSNFVGGISMSAANIDDIANFLRELNALEKIRQVRKRMTFVNANRSSGNTALLNFAIDDMQLALNDLSQKNLNLASQNELANVKQTLVIAAAQPDANRPAYLANGFVYLTLAENSILTSNPQNEFILH